MGPFIARIRVRPVSVLLLLVKDLQTTALGWPSVAQRSYHFGCNQWSGSKLEMGRTQGQTQVACRFHLSIFRRVRTVAKSDYSFVVSVLPSTRPHGRTRPPLDGFSWSLIFERFSKICRKKLKFHYNLTRITDTLHEDQCTFLVISRSFLLRSVSDNRCRENPHILYSITCPKILPFIR
jgi:hypothetical protein